VNLFFALKSKEGFLPERKSKEGFLPERKSKQSFPDNCYQPAISDRLGKINFLMI